MSTFINLLAAMVAIISLLICNYCSEVANFVQHGKQDDYPI